jgi:phosphatidylglycerol:prolipoprotein diacylglycerol transferase
MPMLTFPQIDPVFIHIGPFSIYWYGIAYVVGLLGGWQYAVWIARRWWPAITKPQIDDFMIWALGGVIIGGRLGHILFFELDRYLANPSEIFMTWKGGMSFHGGFLGVIIAMILYCRKKNIPLLRFADIFATITPIGLFFGRIANFINGELFGRITDIPLGMVFPHGGPLPRHPSQIYEALSEGLLLFIVLHIGCRIAVVRKVPGRLTGIFFMGYGLARTLIEFVREPDALHVVLGMDLTTGQLLSLPMILAGAYLIWQPKRCPESPLCP